MTRGSGKSGFQRGGGFTKSDAAPGGSRHFFAAPSSPPQKIHFYHYAPLPPFLPAAMGAAMGRPRKRQSRALWQPLRPGPDPPPPRSPYMNPQEVPVGVKLNGLSTVEFNHACNTMKLHQKHKSAFKNARSKTGADIRKSTPSRKPVHFRRYRTRTGSNVGVT